ETPANAADNPASGCRLKPKNRIAPSGTRTTYPTEAATLESTPMSTTNGVTSFLGALVTVFVIKALIYPLFSATPTPIIATSTGPSATKEVKFVTILENI